jgi:hypothetical protein
MWRAYGQDDVHHQCPYLLSWNFFLDCLLAAHTNSPQPYIDPALLQITTLQRYVVEAQIADEDIGWLCYSYTGLH